MNKPESDNLSDLPESHDYLRAALDCVGDPVLVLHRDFRVAHANQAARERYRLHDEAKGVESCYELTHHSDAPCQSSDCPCPLPEVLRSKSPATHVHLHYDADGNEEVTEITASPILDAQGEVLLVIEVWRDITQSERQAHELRAIAALAKEASSSLKLKDVLRNIVRTAADAMNAKVCTIRLVEGDYLSIGAAVGYEDERRRNHRIKIDEKMKRVIRDRAPLVIEDLLAAPDVPLRRVERARLENVRSFLAVPVVSRNETIGVLSVYKECAHKFSKNEINLFFTIAYQAAPAIENARLFGQIARGKRDWESTFDAIDDSICILDDNGEVLRVNAATTRFLNKTFDECIGEKCYRLFHNADRPPEACLHFNGKKRGCAQRWELEDANLGRHLQVSVFPRHNGNGDVATTVHVVRDITESKEMERFLLRVQRMQSLGTLAAGIAHEYNNIHQGIMGFADLLIINGGLPSKVIRELQRIRSLARRASDLASQLLLFSETGATNKQATDIHELIDETIGILKDELEADGIDVLAAYSRDIPRLMIDANLMRQVLISLVTNARHSMAKSEKKTVNVETGRSDGMVKINISDTGHGIKKNDLEHVFDPFFTTKGALGSGEIFDGKIYGTGLGLSMSHAIVLNHGGMLTVKSKEGKGATFTISLPESLAAADP